MIQERLLEHLRAVMVDVVFDDTQAGVIKPGLLHDDPSTTRIAIQILSGGEDWPDELNTDNEGPDAFAPFTYEIGPAQTTVAYWRRRFRIEPIIFLDGESSLLQASRKANVVISRLHSALMETPLDDLIDDFGEHCYDLQVRKMHFTQTGDDGTYIWRGTIYVEFFTSIPHELA